MIENTRITVGTAIVLEEMFNRLKYVAVRDENGEGKLEDRLIPFSVRYKIDRNLMPLSRTVEVFHEKRRKVLADILATMPEGSKVSDDPRKYQSYVEIIRLMMDEMVDLSVNKLEPDEINVFRDAEDLRDVNDEAIKLFIGYCTNDRMLLQSMNVDLEVKVPEEGKPAGDPEGETSVPSETAADAQVKAPGPRKPRTTRAQKTPEAGDEAPKAEKKPTARKRKPKADE